MKSTRMIAALGCVAVALASGACSRTADAPAQSAETKRSYPYKVAATVGMVADIVRSVAGDKAQVEGIIGTGVDPHLYQPTRNDVVALMSADVVFYSGLMLEGKLSDTLIKIARKRAVFAVTELVDEQYLLSPDEFAGHFDPHLWMDVAGWMQAVEAVQLSLSEFDPDHATNYAENAARYIEQCQALHQYAIKAIASVPEEQRLLVTAHDAFNYFGRAYGIEVRGIQGISTESEAGLEDIRKLVGEIVERDLDAVFIETSVPDKNIKALIEGAASRGKTVIIGGALFSDAMGPAGTYEGTYIGMIDHNVTTIARALGGKAPEKGMQGKLTGFKSH
ncbi:MAG: zinc ABC transporter substrate-binding protein [Verrucomicrobia bacterium]|nr:zinc ABC transporter substrate-binding protein [Verrucomicrobiota bacterium]MDA1088282.1 zinc ABC transporter substrate-binding protein [Verrucomicrobiota bacterium]